MANYVLKTKIEINKKFGMLLVTKELVERVYKGKNKEGYDLWIRQVECLCDCGNIVNRPYTNLVKGVKRGNVPNCGCLQYRTKTRIVPKIEGLVTKEDKYKVIKELSLTREYNNKEIAQAVDSSLSFVDQARVDMGVTSYSIKGIKNEELPIGKKYNRLTIIGPSDKKSKKGQKFVTVQCDCGVIKEIKYSTVKSGDTKSCGCLSKEIAKDLMAQRIIENRKHGDSNRKSKHSYIYQIWMGMKSRCYDENNKRYSTYGGRGLTVYEPWINDYILFKEWLLTNLGERYDANTGKRSDNESFDRIDVNVGYYPGNLRWADFVTQANNKVIQSKGHKTRNAIEKETGVRTLLGPGLKKLYEEYYNVKVTKGNIIHHINWDGLDNSKKNLLEVTRAEHGWLHQANNYELRTQTRGKIIKLLKKIDWVEYFKFNPRR
jgi:hypothetical protein